MELARDIVGALASALVEAVKQAHGPALQVGKDMIFGRLDLPGDDVHEFTVLSLPLEGAADLTLRLVLSSPLLDALAGAAAQSTVDPRREMPIHLQRAWVKGTVWLGTARAAMRDILALESQDILLLDGGVADELEVHVQGRPLLTGHLAQSQGCYALQVARPAGAI